MTLAPVALPRTWPTLDTRYIPIACFLLACHIPIYEDAGYISGTRIPIQSLSPEKTIDHVNHERS